jgi:Rho termination factor, N-terminal domain
VRDPHFLARRRNGAAEAAPQAGAWWVLDGQANGNGVDASKSKRQLYAEAKQAGIQGRSSMNKKQLVEALHRHHSRASSQEPPRRTSRPVRLARPELGPPPRGRHTAASVGRAEAPEAERCTIRHRAAGANGEFHVLVTDTDGSHSSVARSPAFPSRAGGIRRTGAARAAHDLLAQRLIVAGWWPADSRDAWPEIQFVRISPAGSAGARSLVTVVREGGRARFVIEELDSYGNATPLVASDLFWAPRLLPVRPSRHAKAALKQLLDRLEPDGWTVAEHIGAEWYSLSLWRSRRDSRR